MSEFERSAEQPAIQFVSALALEESARFPSGAVEKVDRSRVHVVWSVSKDFGSSGISMVRNTTSIERRCNRRHGVY